MLAKTELPTVEERCGTCRYWLEESAGRYAGEDESDLTSDCRRYPPRHNRPGEDDHHTPLYGFPRTEVGAWCGEWRAKTGDILVRLYEAANEYHMARGGGVLSYETFASLFPQHVPPAPNPSE